MLFCRPPCLHRLKYNISTTELRVTSYTANLGVLSCQTMSDFAIFWCAPSSTTYLSKQFHHPHNHSDKDRTWSSSGYLCTSLADDMAVSSHRHRNLSQPHKTPLTFQRDNDKTLQERCPESMQFPAMLPQARNTHHLRHSDKDGWTETGLSWRFLYPVPRMSGKSAKIFLNLNPTANRFKTLVYAYPCYKSTQNY